MKTFAKLTLVVLGATGVTAMRVNLYARRGDATFVLDTTQLCYSFEDAWSDVAYAASWKSLSDAYSIAFHEHVECRGKYVTSREVPTGSITFSDDLKFAVSSVMVQQFTTHPTSGLTYISAGDPADIFENATNLEASSESGSGVDAGTL